VKKIKTVCNIDCPLQSNQTFISGADSTDKFSLRKPFTLVFYLQVGSGAYPREEATESCSTRVGFVVVDKDKNFSVPLMASANHIKSLAREH
jgi:hypothetical protein